MCRRSSTGESSDGLGSRPMRIRREERRSTTTTSSLRTRYPLHCLCLLRPRPRCSPCLPHAAAALKQCCSAAGHRGVLYESAHRTGSFEDAGGDLLSCTVFIRNLPRVLPLLTPILISIGVCDFACLLFSISISFFRPRTRYSHTYRCVPTLHASERCEGRNLGTIWPEITLSPLGGYEPEPRGMQR